MLPINKTLKKSMIMSWKLDHLIILKYYSAKLYLKFNLFILEYLKSTFQIYFNASFTKQNDQETLDLIGSANSPILFTSEQA